MSPTNGEINVDEIEKVLNRMYDSNCPTAEKQQYESELKNLQRQQFRHNNLLNLAYQLITYASANEYVLWYATELLEFYLLHTTNQIQEKKQLIDFLISQLVSQKNTNNNNNLPPFIATKFVKIIVTIGKLDWPEQVPEFFSRVLSLVQTNETRQLGLELVLMCAQEFRHHSKTNSEKSRILCKRQQQLQTHLVAEMPTLITTITNILQQISTTLTVHLNEMNVSEVNGNLLINHNVEYEDTIGALCLNALTELMSWIPLEDYLSAHFYSTVLGFYILAYPQYLSIYEKIHSVNNFPINRFYLRNSSIAGLNFLVEIVSKKKTMANSSNIFNGFIQNHLPEFIVQFLKLLHQENSNDGSNVFVLEIVGEEYVDKITEFLEAFFSNLLNVVEQSSSGSDLLQYLFNYSCNQPHAIGFLNCLDIWSIFVNYVSEEERNEGSAQEKKNILICYENGLSQLMFHLVDCLQYTTNGKQLEELDDEVNDTSDSTNRNSDTNSSKELKKELNVIINTLSNASLSESQSGDSIEFVQSEYQEYITNCLSLLRRIAELPSCAPRLLECILPLFRSKCEEFTQFYITNIDTSSSNVNHVHFIRDFCGICSLVACVSASYYNSNCSTNLSINSSDNQLIGWQVLKLFLEICNQITFHRLHTRGAHFVNLHCEVLVGVRLSCGILKSLYNSGSDAKNEVYRSIQEILMIIQQILDTSIVPSPENVMHVSMDLLCTLGYLIPWEEFSQLPEMLKLSQNVSVLAPNLPLLVQGQLYTSMCSVHLNAFSSTSMTNESQIQHLYQSYLTPLVNSIVEIESTICLNSSRVNDAQLINQLKRDCTIISCLATTIQDSNKSIKDIFYQTLYSVNYFEKNCLSLLSMYLSNSNPSKENIQLSSCLTRFFSCFLRTIRKQLPIDNIGNIVNSFLTILQTPEVAQRLNASQKFGSSLCCSFLDLLEIVMEEPTSTFNVFIPSILDLCFGALKPLIFDGPTRDTILPYFIDLITQVLEKHFRFFVVSKTTLNDNNIPQRKAMFASDSAQSYFITIFEAVGSVLSRSDIPPPVCKQCLNFLVRLNDAHRLFGFDGFMCNPIRLAYIETILDLLVGGGLSLLREELIRVLFELIRVDEFQSFGGQILPTFLTERYRFSTDMVQDLIGSLFHNSNTVSSNNSSIITIDFGTFQSNFEVFRNDFKVYQVRISE